MSDIPEREESLRFITSSSMPSEPEGCVPSLTRLGASDELAWGLTYSEDELPRIVDTPRSPRRAPTH